MKSKPVDHSAKSKAAAPSLGASGFLRDPTGTYLLRAWLVGMFAATLWVTRRLWTEHVEPPLLPLVELPAFNGYGELLLLTACLFVIWPRVGLAANVVVGVTAMIADQTRMQPQLFSFWLLMLGTLGRPAALWQSRCHLASLWFFSGFHKLLSPAYFTEVGPWMWQTLFHVSIWPDMPDYSRQFAAAIAYCEMALGLGIWFVPLRKVVAVAGALLHCGVVVMLYRSDWNTSVWAWNLAIAAAALVFVGGWKTRLRNDAKQMGAPALVVGLLLLLSPALFYVGKLDAYLSYCLYSANVPTATMYPAADSGRFPYHIQSQDGPYWKNLNVPQPPAHRNFENYFRRVAKPGDSMLVEDNRVWARSRGWGRYAWRFDEQGIHRIPLPQSGLAHAAN